MYLVREATMPRILDLDLSLAIPHDGVIAETLGMDILLYSGSALRMSCRP